MHKIITDTIQYIHSQIPEYSIIVGGRDDVIVIGKGLEKGEFTIVWAGDIDDPSMVAEGRPLHITEEQRRLVQLWRVLDG